MSESIRQFVLQLLLNPDTFDEHEWIKYQRYLAEHERQHGKASIEQPLDFQEFRAWLERLAMDPNDLKNTSINDFKSLGKTDGQTS